MGLDLDLKILHPAGLRKGIIHFGQLPQADARLASEIIQRARAVRVQGVHRAAIDAVIIDERLRRIHRAEAVVVVQHGIFSTVAQRAKQVAEIFVVEGVRYDDALDLHRLEREAEDAADAGMRVVTVWDVDRHVEAVDIDIAVRVLRAERLVREHGNETELARRLILALHADVINLVRLRIGERHKLRAFTPDGRAAAVRAEETVGNHPQVEVRQVARAGERRGGDEHFQIRFWPRAVRVR